MQLTVADTAAPRWTPPELGFTRATLAAIVLVAAIAGLIYYATVVLAPKPRPQIIQITQAQLATLPQPTPPPPPPPPKVIPPPKPLPVITKPPPVPSKIVVPTKPPPPVKYVPRPVHRVVIHHPTPPVVHPPPPQPAPAPTQAPVAAKPTPPAAPVENTSGIAAYGSEIHSIVQQNQSVPPALAQLGASGTTVVAILVAPSGQVLSASVVRSSGNPLIDATALDHAEHARFAPFNSNMPTHPYRFTIPVEIDASDSDSSGD